MGILPNPCQQSRFAPQDWTGSGLEYQRVIRVILRPANFKQQNLE